MLNGNVFLKKINFYYLKILNSRKSVFALGLNSFLEALFAPIPVVVLLAPLCIAFPRRAWFYAFVVTLCGTVGSTIVFLLGFFCSNECIKIFIKLGGNIDHLSEVIFLLKNNIFLFLPTITAFIPIPYKISCFAVGIIAGELVKQGSSELFFLFAMFVIGSLLGRYIRFLIEAYFFAFGFKFLRRLLVYLRISKINNY